MPQPQAPLPSVSVVVVSWNSRDDLRDCLDSLRAQKGGELEIIVVDNGSEDDTVEMVRDDFPEVVLIDAGENIGFAEGCNRGIEVAQGEWIATLNPDAIAAPSWISELRAAIAGGGPKLGMLQSKILFKNRPDVTNSTGVLIFYDGSAYDRDYNKPARPDDVQEEIFCVSAGAAIYRRTMLEEVRLPTGHFDRTFFMYFEDVDLGWRCRLAGWEAAYVPTAAVYHRFHASASKRGEHFVSLQCRQNRLRTLIKNGSLGFVLRGMPWTINDLLWSMTKEGLDAVTKYQEAFQDGLKQRAAVEQMARVKRRAVERRWVTNVFRQIIG